ncbi:hypothetical protein ABEG10_25250 [Burkholderia cenocepacia]|uniref:hypothetical protein n=1 Tax=Burkholderia cenocepacia TaxID=95486 RepID=UPI00209D7E74|nr:hypothetical protein [Burkholderia cenocepacia]MCO8321487.1 hypothetical protein [Burkholderia cenocepacia]MCO8328771.1 hypothetical protein [Burkholderia cenocepacia]MCO8336057.1 hypothetical protein [Burkholderia cenocepacia]MCO8343342.1 hypothetical protein [Burkholderia cenocepacia]MCO8356624.1 hypothetical protein [Burkholderia cenocepacia]
MFEKIFDALAAKNKKAKEEHAAQPEEQKFFIEVRGVERGVNFGMMPATVGYMLADEFEQKYLLSKDREERRAFLLEVVSYASVESEQGVFEPLSDVAAVDRLVGHWSNLESIFHACLLKNDIDYQRIEEVSMKAWERAGERFANEFYQASIKMALPMLEQIGTEVQSGQQE